MTLLQRTLNNGDLCLVDDFVCDYMGVYWGSTLETLWGCTEGLLGFYSACPFLQILKTQKNSYDLVGKLMKLYENH